MKYAAPRLLPRFFGRTKTGRRTSVATHVQSLEQRVLPSLVSLSSVVAGHAYRPVLVVDDPTSPDDLYAGDGPPEINTLSSTRWEARAYGNSMILQADGRHVYNTGPFFNSRGMMEFDLTDMAILAGTSIHLDLGDLTKEIQDRPPRSDGVQLPPTDNTINVFGYAGNDLQITAEDYNAPATLLATIATRTDSVGRDLQRPLPPTEERPPLFYYGLPAYHVDVTAFVVAALNSGARTVGFRFHAATATSYESFGYVGELSYEGGDAIAREAKWNESLHTAEFPFELTASELTKDFNSDVYWANGPTVADVIGEPIETFFLGREHVVDQISLPFTSLGTKPNGATHLVFVIDKPTIDHPKGLVRESDETNNVAWLQLPDLIPPQMDVETGVEGFHWDSLENGGGFTFSYEVEEFVPKGTQIRFMWTNGPSSDNEAETALLLTLDDSPLPPGVTGSGDLRKEGHHTVRVQHSALNRGHRSPVSGEKEYPYLVMVLDSEEKIPEVVETNRAALKVVPLVVNVVTHGFQPVDEGVPAIFGTIAESIRELPADDSILDGRVASVVPSWDATSVFRPAFASLLGAKIALARSQLPGLDSLKFMLISEGLLYSAKLLAPAADSKLVEAADAQFKKLFKPSENLLIKGDEWLDQHVSFVGHSRGAMLNATMAAWMVREGFKADAIDFTSLDGYDSSWSYGDDESPNATNGILSAFSIGASVAALAHKWHFTVDNGLERDPLVVAGLRLTVSPATIAQIWATNSIKSPPHFGTTPAEISGGDGPSSHTTIQNDYYEQGYFDRGYIWDNAHAITGPESSDLRLNGLMLLMSAFSGESSSASVTAPISGFLDGELEELGNAVRYFQSFASLLGRDPEMDGLIATLLDTTALLDAYWSPEGDVALGQTQYNTSLRLSANGSAAAIGQSLNLDGATSLGWRVTASDGQPDGVLRVLLDGALIEELGRDALAVGFKSVALPEGVSGVHRVQFEFSSTSGIATSIELDSFALGPNVRSPLIDVDVRSNAVFEGALPGSAVGVTAMLVDSPNVRYFLEADADGRFVIDTVTGLVTATDGTRLDRESVISWAITIKAERPDGSFEVKDVAISVKDHNEFGVSPVTNATPGVIAVREHSPSGTTIGLVASALDRDATFSQVSYSLWNTRGGRFAIDPVTGVVTVGNGEFLDREAQANWTITVLATSQDGSVSVKEFLVSLIDVDEFNLGRTFDLNAAPNTVPEMAPNGTTVGITGFAIDLDATHSAVTYSLWNTHAGRFAIDPTTGVVTVANPALLNREREASWAVTVVAASQDGSKSAKEFIVQVTDVNEFKVGLVSDTNTAGNTVSETASTGTAVGITAKAVDQDATNSTITYSLTSSAGGRFAINSSTGVITVANPTLLNREASGAPSSYDVTVQAASQDGSTILKVFTIPVTDADEFDVTPVSDVNAAANTVVENSLAGTPVGITARATDGDVSNHTVTYSLTNDAGGRFQIDPVTGFVSVAVGAVLDFETRTSHDITMKATSSDGSTSSQTFTIAVTNLFDAPRITLSGSSVAENLPSGTTVGNLGTADVNVTSPVFTLVSGSRSTDNARFSISGNQLRTRAKFNFEAKSSYSIRLQMKGAGGVTLTQVFTILVTDVAEGATVGTAAMSESDAAGIDSDTDVPLNYTLVTAGGRRRANRG
jgi:hypothetical protein